MANGERALVGYGTRQQLLNYLTVLHGVTGVSISLETIRPLFGQFPDLQVRINVAIKKGWKLMWEGGL